MSRFRRSYIDSLRRSYLDSIVQDFMGDNISSELRDDDDDYHDEPQPVERTTTTGTTRAMVGDGESSGFEDDSEESDGEYVHETLRAEAIALRQRHQASEARLSELLLTGPRLGLMGQEEDDLPGELMIPLSSEAGLRRAVEQSRRVSEETKLLQEEKERAKRSEIARDMKHQNEMEELRRRIEELERQKQRNSETNSPNGAPESDSSQSSSDGEFEAGSKKKRKLEPRIKRTTRSRTAKLPPPKVSSAFDQPMGWKSRGFKSGTSQPRGIAVIKSRPTPAAAAATPRDDANCPICLEPIVDSERGLLEPCMHARYHYQCAMDLFVNHGKCCMHNPAGAITGVKKIYA